MPEFDEITPPSGLEVIGAIFAAALDKPVGYLGVSETLADRIVKERCKKLLIFSRDGNPSDLREIFNLALNFTDNGHQFCKLFLTIASRLNDLGEYNDSNLFMLARINLDKDRPEDAKMKMVRDETLLIIMKEMERPDNSKTFKEIISSHFKNNTENERLIAAIEATLLVATKDQITYSLNLFRATAYFGLICRGLFYRAIVESVGSRLETTASRKKFDEKVKEIPLEIISSIPGVGEGISAFKLLCDLLYALIDKEAALVKMQKEMSSSYELALEFGQAYTLTLTAWSEWATKLQDSAIENLKATTKLLSVEKK